MISRVLQGKSTSMTQPFHYANTWADGQYYTYYHGGVDLTGFNGQYNVIDWIVAHSEGVVVGIETQIVGYLDGSYGNYVLLKHPNGYYTMYAHLEYGTVKVKYGESVKKGQVLGLMGSSGHSFGSHLHWELRSPAGVCIDPAPYLNADLPGMKPYKPLKVNGVWNKATTKRLQKIFGTTKDGIVSDQDKKLKELFPTATSWKFVKKPTVGSSLIKAMQKWLKIKQTGVADKKFIRALQKKAGVTQTGILDKATVKKLQKWINKKLS